MADAGAGAAAAAAPIWSAVGVEGCWMMMVRLIVVDIDSIYTLMGRQASGPNAAAGQ